MVTFWVPILDISKGTIHDGSSFRVLLLVSLDDHDQYLIRWDIHHHPTSWIYPLKGTLLWDMMGMVMVMIPMCCGISTWYQGVRYPWNHEFAGIPWNGQFRHFPKMGKMGFFTFFRHFPKCPFYPFFGDFGNEIKVFISLPFSGNMGSPGMPRNTPFPGVLTPSDPEIPRNTSPRARVYI